MYAISIDEYTDDRAARAIFSFRQKQRQFSLFSLILIRHG
jgi:hypothetical protein